MQEGLREFPRTFGGGGCRSRSCFLFVWTRSCQSPSLWDAPVLCTPSLHLPSKNPGEIWVEDFCLQSKHSIFSGLFAGQLSENISENTSETSWKNVILPAALWAAANGGVTNEGLRGVWPPFLEIGRNRPFSAFFTPFLEGPNGTWKIQKTEEKGLFPQISSDLLKPPSLKPPFAVLQVCLSLCFAFVRVFVGHLRGCVK